MLWAPWRIQYIQMERPEGCILCDKPAEHDDVRNYILQRGRLNFVIMNSFPYNPGHLMVVPHRHVAGLDSLTDEERAEHFALVARGIAILRESFTPGGFNIGANMGKIAGAGIDDHYHTHIVPRWQGDSNFMPVVADTKVLPQALAETFQKLSGKF